MYIIRIQFVVLDPYVSLNVRHYKLVKALVKKLEFDPSLSQLELKENLMSQLKS